LPPAFLRRCIFHYVTFPDDVNRLEEILAVHDAKIPKETRVAGAAELQKLRKLSLTKPPGISELIDWVSYVHGTGGTAADFAKRRAIGAALKNTDDQEKALQAISAATQTTT
jgi:MoxR-like ATPase